MDTVFLIQLTERVIPRIYSFCPARWRGFMDCLLLHYKVFVRIELNLFFLYPSVNIKIIKTSSRRQLKGYNRLIKMQYKKAKFSPYFGHRFPSTLISATLFHLWDYHLTLSCLISVPRPG
jgi:hypothetical protein